VNGEELRSGHDLVVALAQPAELETPPPRRFAMPIELPRGTTRLIVTTERRELRAGEFLLDAGLPFTPAELGASLFRADGTRAVDALEIHPSAMRADRLTMKPARFWQDPVWVQRLAEFATAGGIVQRPQ
jgi:hypothetical protein